MSSAITASATSELDTEWMQFLSSMKETSNISLNVVSGMISGNGNKKIDNEFYNEEENSSKKEKIKKLTYIPPPPEICTELLISTKTKVLFLNSHIPIDKIFWNIPLLDYWIPIEGIVKKTVKIVSLTREKVDELEHQLSLIPCFKQDIIRKIDIPAGSTTITPGTTPGTGRGRGRGRGKSKATDGTTIEDVEPAPSQARFKDERKISIGISKKDIMACRTKKKNVFYNCFSLMLRIFHINEFREIHVKIFNTGKMEIPGVLNKDILEKSKNLILNILRPVMKPFMTSENGGELDYIVMKDENRYNVLINSNFNCGFFIQREKLHQILREKYNLDTSYDPCTYPGVKCKFYFNNELGLENAEKQNGCIDAKDYHLKMKNIQNNKKYKEVSIMIFRTGSGLIVGNCCEETLNLIFRFIVKILHDEYYEIYIPNNSPVMKQKTTKVRRKTVVYTNGIGPILPAI